MDFDYGMLSDPHVYKVNALPAHSDHVVYTDMNEMLRAGMMLKDCLKRAAAGEDMKRPVDETFFSSMRLSLNGFYKFHYAKNRDAVIPGFFAEDFDVSGWDDIYVPAHIEMEGFGKPQYVNIQYPWDGHEDVPRGKAPVTTNPVGSYVRDIRIPERWNGNRVFISFRGVESGLSLWLNGEFVGYSEDSFTPSEFELTPYVKEGWNRLAIQVYKWTSGSWFEDQDFFRFSGIFRDVYLYEVPALHIFDLRVKAIPTRNFAAGNFSVRADFHVPYPGENEMPGARQRYQGRLHLILKHGETRVLDMEVPIREKTIIKKTIDRPVLWSAEDPQLYDLFLEVLDASGRVVEAAGLEIGFRRFEMKDGLMCLNGKRIVFKGVNRHEWSAKRGRVPDFAEAVYDIAVMKRNNINALRTSHYVNAFYIYRICDFFGIYVMAENNMETHGTWVPYLMGKQPKEAVLPGDHIEYLPMLLDRVDSTCRLLRNHPSILIWSIGNESFGGYVAHEMANRFRTHDPDRLVHYEGIANDPRYPDTSDMVSRMYMPAKDIEKWLDTHPEKPFISCEMSHSMGNSNGGLYKYTELTEKRPRYQGGFIWDFIDQAIYQKDCLGNEYLAYGGDFGDRPNDRNFSGNGLLTADRKPYGKMQEVKYLYQNISIEVGPRTFTVDNRNLFVGTGLYDCAVRLEKEGVVYQELHPEIDVPPLSRMTFNLPPVRWEEPGEYVFTVSMTLKEDMPWALKGHEVAFGQTVYLINGREEHRLTERERVRFERKRPGLTVVRGDFNIGVVGDHFEVLFSLRDGNLVSYRCGDIEYLSAPPRADFWRAPTDNDRGWRMPERLSAWKLASLYASTMPLNKENEDHDEYPKIKESEDYFEICFRKFLPSLDDLPILMTYLVFPNGTVRILLDMEAGKNLPPLPGFGLLFRMEADYDRMAWYGLGPEENYCDRNMGAKLGVFTGRVADNVEPYLKPQECGNRTGVRWALVQDKKGRGLIFSVPGWKQGTQTLTSINSANPLTGETMNFQAIPYSAQMLETVEHASELPAPRYTFVRVSLTQMGVGGDDSWGARPLPEYIPTAERPIHFEVEFRQL